MNSIQGQGLLNIPDYFQDGVVQIGNIRKLGREKVAELLANIYGIDKKRFHERIAGEKRIETPFIEGVVRTFYLIMNSPKEIMESEEYFQN